MPPNVATPRATTNNTRSSSLLASPCTIPIENMVLWSPCFVRWPWSQVWKCRCCTRPCQCSCTWNTLNSHSNPTTPIPRSMTATRVQVGEAFGEERLSECVEQHRDDRRGHHVAGGPGHAHEARLPDTAAAGDQIRHRDEVVR